jgi:hypothetical protein
MSERAKTITISVILALAIGAAGIYLSGKLASLFKGGGKDGSDSPIVMAGGSLYLSTTPPNDLESSAGMSLYFGNVATGAIKNRYISSLEITDKDGKVTPFAQVNSPTLLTAVVDYKGGLLDGSDYVTISYMPTNGCGVITITNEKNNIGTAIKLLPNLRLHHKRKFSISGFSVNGSDTNTNCASGDCSLTIHTLTSSSTCP